MANVNATSVYVPVIVSVNDGEEILSVNDGEEILSVNDGEEILTLSGDCGGGVYACLTTGTGYDFGRSDGRTRLLTGVWEAIGTETWIATLNVADVGT